MELDIPPFSPTRGYMAVFIAWLSAQLLKVLQGIVAHKRFNFRWLFDTGGMPSSHSSSVGALATTVGLYYGFGSLPFLITLIFSIITLFDAAGVRRSVGKQAGILNKMLDDLYQKGQVPETRLKELLGHTPVEVLAGAFLGSIISLIICR